MGPDVLEAVAHAGLVVGALEDETVSGARVLDRLLGHLFELIPGLGWFRKTALLQQVLSIVEHPRVRQPGDAPDLALVGEGLYLSANELASLTLREAAGNVRDPAVFGQLRSPGDGSYNDVHLAASSLELGFQSVEVLLRFEAYLPVLNLEVAPVLLVELVYQPMNSACKVGRIEDDFA